MSVHDSRLAFAAGILMACAGPALPATPAAELAPLSATMPARKPADLAGAWALSVADTGETCPVRLRAERGLDGAYLIGITPACRHSIPEIAGVGHWTMPDPLHITLTGSSGATILTLAAAGDAFTAMVGDRSLTLTQGATAGRSADGFAPVDGPSSASGFATIIPISKRARVATAVEEAPSDLGGRYAVMREKRDTGCMVTLDEKSRVKGGARAQLAPGCRDQGIVIFDPAAWAVVKGELVLTARAGHKAHLLKVGEGHWQKDPKDGGKPLGLKKL